ncbi:MAG TPA: Kiwa anti-phage protein KwaB-like domain-containing protein [Ktedonobacteraceae bacterium]|nr:Kiwa anti-phage protein KwaB-like domain-containing protein [Ktedonobacteraceae bacterium]
MTETNGNLKDLFDEILALDIHTCALTVCLASSPKNEILPLFERLQLSEGLTEVFRDVVLATLEQCKKELHNGNLALHTYATDSKPDAHEVEYLDLSGYATVLEQLDPLSSLADIDVFEEDEKFIAGLRFYVMTVQPDEGEPVYFFRAYSPKKLLSRSSMFAIWHNSGGYDKVTVPVFLFDHHIDCISVGKHMFVFKKDHFQEMFHFFEILRKLARETLDIIRHRGFIENFDEFAHDCEAHLPKLAKLRNIAMKPYFNRLTIDDIKKVIEKNHLSVRTVIVHNKEMLLYDPADKWVLLKLLDDNYLWSLMTDMAYEVSGKRELAGDAG